MQIVVLLVAVFAGATALPQALAGSIACTKMVQYDLPTQSKKLDFCATKNGVLFSAQCAKTECEAWRKLGSAKKQSLSGRQLAQNPASVRCLELGGKVTTGYDEAANELCFCFFKKDQSAISCGGLVR